MSNTANNTIKALYERLKILGHAIPMNNKENRAVRGAYIHAAIMCHEYTNSCKQQILDAYNQGYRDGEVDAANPNSNDLDIASFSNAETYYNEKYGQK